MQGKKVRCAICGREQELSSADYIALVEVLGKAQGGEDIVDTCVCGACGGTEQYKQHFLKGIPHIVLA